MSLVIIFIIHPISHIALNKFESIQLRYSAEDEVAFLSSGIWFKGLDLTNNAKLVIHADQINDNNFINVETLAFDQEDNFLYRLDTKLMKLDHMLLSFYDVRYTNNGNQLKFYNEYNIKTNIVLEQIKNSFVNPKNITLWELPNFISTLEKAGFSTIVHYFYFYNILMTPVFLIVMSTIPVIFATKNIRSNKQYEILFGSFIIGFIVYLSDHIANMVATNGQVPVIIASVFPILFISLIVFAIIIKSETA